MTTEVGITRGGPKQPRVDLPALPVGSVRRTSAIDSLRPDGIEGDVRVHALARDLRTAAGGTIEVLGRAGFDAVITPDRVLGSIGPDPRLGDLVGETTASGFRATAAALLADEAEGRTLLHLLLDDLPAANLVSGYASQRDPERGDHPVPPEYLDAATDICAGWARGATIVQVARRTGSVPTPTAAPIDPGPDDDASTHGRPPLPPGGLRRARRLDTHAIAPGVVDFEAHFRDSYVDADGTEGAVHEYTVRGRFDSCDRRIASIDATAHVLPWMECPRALASVDDIVGCSTDDLRAHVRSELVGTSTCTHLNDTLRSLADLPVLADALSRG